MRDQSWLGLALCIIINIPATCRWLSRGTWGISGSTWVTALFHLHGWGVKQGRGRGRERERPPPSSSSSLLPLQPVPRHRTTAGTELWFLVEQPTGHEQWWMHLTDLLNLFLKRTPEKHTRSKWEKNKNQQNDGMHSAKISVVIKVNKPKGLGGLLVKSSVNCNTWSLRIFSPSHKGLILTWSDYTVKTRGQGSHLHVLPISKVFLQHTHTKSTGFLANWLFQQCWMPFLFYSTNTVTALLWLTFKWKKKKTKPPNPLSVGLMSHWQRVFFYSHISGATQGCVDQGQISKGKKLRCDNC